MAALALPAAILMSIVGVLGVVDGLYFHIWKFRLHERPQSRREHAIHGLRALLAAPAIYGLFVVPVSGVVLWLVSAVVAADVLVMIWDLFEESSSRRDLGGIPRFEYIIHVVATGFHMASCALALASRPIEAWSGVSSMADLPPLVSSVGMLALPAAIGMALVHFALLLPGVAGLLPRATAYRS